MTELLLVAAEAALEMMAVGSIVNLLLDLREVMVVPLLVVASTEEEVVGVVMAVVSSVVVSAEVGAMVAAQYPLRKLCSRTCPFFDYARGMHYRYIILSPPFYTDHQY